jgi:hypothetical protein
MESDEHEEEGSDVLTPTSGEEDDNNHVHIDQDLDISEDGHASLPTPSESSAPSSDAEIDQGRAFDDEPDDRDTAKIAFDEGTTRMPDDTVVMDSENFTMISLDTLLSNGTRSPPKPEHTQNTTAPTVGSSLRHEYLGPSTVTMHNAEISPTREVAPPLSQTFTASAGPVRPKLSRFVTPVVDADLPSAPPALEPILPKPQTPTLGRVVTAGVALQGLLDPTRLTPEPSQQALDKKRDQLDDLFRGFSEGSRKELQAGLRLGEQLAESQTHEESAPAASSPIKSYSTTAPQQGVFRTQRKYRQSRLLTPEDQDHVISPVEPSVTASEVQYPALNVEEEESAPTSPARSEGEMSWRVDTPPRRRTGMTQKDDDIEEANHNQPAEETEKPPQWDNYADIWQEEASRSVNSAEEEEVPGEEERSLRDVFTEDIPTKSARGNLPRTRRRKNANDTRNDDEAKSYQKRSPAQAEPVVPDQPEDGQEEEEEGEGSEVVTPLSEDKPMQDGDESSPASEASDDTGMFFQSNMPNIFVNQKRPSRFEQRRQRRQEKEKVSLS